MTLMVRSIGRMVSNCSLYVFLIVLLLFSICLQMYILLHDAQAQYVDHHHLAVTDIALTLICLGGLFFQHNNLCNFFSKYIEGFAPGIQISDQLLACGYNILLPMVVFKTIRLGLITCETIGLITETYVLDLKYLLYMSFYAFYFVVLTHTLLEFWRVDDTQS